MFPIRVKDLTVMILRNQATVGHLTRSQERSWLAAHPTGIEPGGKMYGWWIPPQNYTYSFNTFKADILLAFISLLENQGSWCRIEPSVLQTLWPHLARLNWSEPFDWVDAHSLGSDQQASYTEELDLFQNIPSVNAQFTKIHSFSWWLCSQVFSPKLGYPAL